MIALIVARASNGVIGNRNDLPWYLPADLRHFKQITNGHTVIMGRRTFESIYSRLRGPLPNRRNIVVSRSLNQVPNGFELADSLESALRQTKDENSTVFVIGGATLYEACLKQHLADKIYLTEINQDIAGDTYFPSLAPDKWLESGRESHPSDSKNRYAYDFVTLERS